MNKNNDTGTPENGSIYARDIERMLNTVVIRGENHREFVVFADNLLSELGPRNKIEMIHAENFIFSAWKYRRMAKLERDALSKQNEPDDNKVIIDRLRNIRKHYRVRTLAGVDIANERVRQIIQYQFALEKSMNKALRLLRAEQGLPVTKFDEINNEE